MLFLKISDAIRSGTLNLAQSYKYRAFEDYLIPTNIWKMNKQELLNRAGLLDMANFANLEKQLKPVVDEHFRKTNTHILDGTNQYATIDEKNVLKLQTPKQEKDVLKTTLELFPRNRFISLFEILSAVHQTTGFLDCFEHWQITHNRQKPSNKTFFAGIIGYGCNLGIGRITKISRSVNAHELENVVNWYFTHDNILRANDKILELLNQLYLPTMFAQDKNVVHTSSDGQRYSIAVESLNANYSYKYLDKRQSVTIYSFIDFAHRLFYSTVINPAERDAAYVIDRLMYNDVVQSDIHSTDTHGYSEMVFRATHLLGISFAPRIKRFKDQQLYSFEPISSYKKMGYAILPKKTIRTDVIAERWDDILRLITTIKLKESTASQLFKRLSSYSKQHPTYRALKQFGKIIKTIFLLTYMDDLTLRQMIEKQLNKLESSNKFGKAVFYGNNQEFQYATKEEQLIADGCKRLIENAIICWNYLYLSKLIYDAQNENERKELFNIIKNGSVVVWQHINLQGEYDFSEEMLKDLLEFKLPELLEIKGV